MLTILKVRNPQLICALPLRGVCPSHERMLVVHMTMDQPMI
jgi:hypothetical protein